MAPHTASGEWQSFEVRMRRRRAERLLLRADVALDAGFRDDARAAILEATRLWPGAPGLSAIEARLKAPPPAPPPARRSWKIDAAIGVAVAAIVATVVMFAMTRTWSNDADRDQPVAAPAAPADMPPPPLSKPAVRDSVTIQTLAIRPVLWPGITDQAVAPRQPLPAEPAQVTATNDRSTASGPARVGTGVDSPRASQEVGARHDPAPAPPTVMASLEPVREPDTIVSPPSPAAPATTPAVPDRTRGGNTTDPAANARVVDERPRISEAVPARLERRAADVAIPSETDLVRGVLHRYADAYTRLDAAAAQAVWPSVNRAALSRAFDGLSEQEIALGNCAIDVRDAIARASCAGSATWAPKVGSGGSRTDPRRWSFELRKSNDGWLISEARVQNR